MKMIGIILAGGNSKRMKKLTERRATPAMPMAGNYRAIDFALTNMANSHIQKVAVVTQYNTRSLNEHLSSSKWWDFGRKQGGLFVYHPTITPENNNWYRGTVDSIYQNLHFLKNSHEPYVVIASGDGIYKLNYNDVLEYHVRNRSDITIVTTKIQDWEDSCRFGQVVTDENNRVTGFEEKPMVESTRQVNCGIYVVRRRLLIELVEQCIQEDRYDFVRDILIRYRNLKRVFAYPMNTYWSSISSAYSYFRTNMDFLKPEVRRFFFTGEDAVMTKVNDLPPAKYNPGSSVKNSLITSGTIVNGSVEDSVIFRKCYLGNGSVLRNCVVLNDVYIGDGAVLENCVVESHTTIKAGSHFKGTSEDVMIVVENNERYDL